MPSRMFKLTVRKGPQEGQSYPLVASMVTLGRDPMADIVITDPEVSRQHARLNRVDEGYEVQDLGSTNGTFVDGQRLGGEPVLLEAGQTVSMGSNVTLIYEAAADPMATVISSEADLQLPDEEEEPEPQPVEEAPDAFEEEELDVEFYGLEEEEESFEEPAFEESIPDYEATALEFPSFEDEEEDEFELPSFEEPDEAPPPDQATVLDMEAQPSYESTPSYEFDEYESGGAEEEALPDFDAQPSTSYPQPKDVVAASETPPPASPPPVDTAAAGGRNRNLTIAAVVILLLLCCCCLAAIGWQFGDQILFELGLY